MNVNITLVTTRTWPGVGPRRFGRGAVMVPDEEASVGFGGWRSAAISSLFRWGIDQDDLTKCMITLELQRARQEAPSRPDPALAPG
jgi:hypothetical protein